MNWVFGYLLESVSRFLSSFFSKPISFGPAKTSDLSEFCFIDIETTGLDPSKGDRIIEYALLKFESSESDQHTCSALSSLINPEGKRSSRQAQAVHKIPAKDLANAPTFNEAIEKIIEFVGSKTLIAHNSKFEQSFFEAEFSRAGRICSFVFVDSIELIREEFPNLKSYSLESLCREFQIDRNVAHRAEADAIALYQLLHRVKALKSK